MADVKAADWSPDGKKIVFCRLGTSTQISILDLTSGAERPLFETDHLDVSGLRWSPDGRRIAVSGTLTTSVTGYKILLLDPDTGEKEEIENLNAYPMFSRPEWSHDSSSLFLAVNASVAGDVSGAPSQVVRHDLGSGVASPLFWTRGLLPFRGSWSGATIFTRLDGGRLVFNTTSQRELLRQVFLESSGERQLTRSIAADRQPAFSPDGLTVVFSSNRAGNLDLWTVDLRSGELRQLTDDTAQDWDPAFTPDGRQILFSSDRGGNLEIWISDADGTHPRQVSADGAAAENPTMTADGRWIVYTSGNPQHLGIFKIQPDGSDATPLVSGDFLAHPEVSPDGRWALYHQDAVLKSTLFVVEVETGKDASFQIETPYKPLSPNVSYGRARWTNEGGGDRLRRSRRARTDRRLRPGFLSPVRIPRNRVVLWPASTTI